MAKKWQKSWFSWNGSVRRAVIKFIIIIIIIIIITIIIVIIWITKFSKQI